MSQPTPEQIAKPGCDEHAEQVALFCWAAMKFDQYPELRLMFAIPNGGERNKIVAARLKAEGVKASVPDIFLPVPRGPWHGLFIEMKRQASENKRAGVAGTDQLQMIQKLRAQGFGASVCVGWKAASIMIEQYLNYH